MNDKIYMLLSCVKNKEIEDGEQLSKAEVNNIMKRFKNENSGTRNITYRKRRIAIAAAIVAAASVIVPGSVYAYSRYYAKIEKTNTYQNTVTVRSVEKVSENEAVTDMAEKEFKDWKFTYLPEGLAEDESGWKYHDYETGAAITPCKYYLPFCGDEIKEEMNFSADCENYETGDKTVMINYKLSYEKEKDDPTNYGRVVWISFNDYELVLQLYISNGLPQDELYKIIDGIELYSIDEETFHERYGYADDENRRQNDDVSEGNIYDDFDKISLDEFTIKKTGDTVTYSEFYSGDISFRVNNVEITDSFDGITTDASGDPADFDSLTDENNNIISNTRTWYRFGDGITTIDEDICSSEMPYHIIKMNVTAEYSGDEYEEIGICPTLVNYNSLFGSVVKFEEDTNIPDGYAPGEVGFRDSIRDEYFISLDGLISMDSDEKNYCTKNYIGLEPGESADFQICFVCSENMLKKDLFVRFYNTDNNLELFKITN